MSLLSKVPVRPVSRMDLERYAAHLKRLDQEDRYRRFCGHMTDEAIETAVGRIYERMKRSDDAVFGHFDTKGELVGAAHFTLGEENGEKFAEVGVSILPEHRGKGVAKALMQRSILHARNLGCMRIETMCLTTNDEMSSLAKSVGMRVKGGFGSVQRHAELELDPPSIGSIGEEAFLTHAAIWDETYDRSLKAGTDFFEQFCMRIAFPLGKPE